MHKLRQIVDKKIEMIESFSNSYDVYYYSKYSNHDMTIIQLTLLNWTATMIGKSKSTSELIFELNKRIEFLEVEQRQCCSKDEEIAISRNLEVLEYCKYLVNRYEI